MVAQSKRALWKDFQASKKVNFTLECWGVLRVEEESYDKVVMDGRLKVL